jgi:hypothetical protein
MKSYEQEIEQEIQEKGLNAPRLTPEKIDSVIVKAEYYTFPSLKQTVCCLTLKNGFTIVGESACVSPENYNKELGDKIAYDNARDKIWAFEGYLLRNQLNESNLPS